MRLAIGHGMPAPIAWLVLLLVVAGCVTAPGHRGPRPAIAALPPRDVEVRGLASWYGRHHHGRLTASGEVYDMHRLTAAHRTLPFGARVRVTNLDNGRAVEVRINDRGPFVGDRVLDLSYAAARRLGAVGDGVIPIRLEVLREP